MPPKSKKKDKKQDSVEVSIEYIRHDDPGVNGDPGQASFGVSHHILDGVILQNVAQNAWEKELVQKFKKPYICKWASNQSVHMYQLRQEDLGDNKLVTPRGLGRQSQSSQPQSKGQSHSVSPSMMLERYKNITQFPHYQQNAQSLIKQREYEENEAPPVTKDRFMKENIKSSGQYLYKYQVENQEAIRDKEARAKALAEGLMTGKRRDSVNMMASLSQMFVKKTTKTPKKGSKKFQSIGKTVSQSTNILKRLQTNSNVSANIHKQTSLNLQDSPLKGLLGNRNSDIMPQKTKKAPFYEPESLMDRENMVEFSDEEDFQKHERTKSIGTNYGDDSNSHNVVLETKFQNENLNMKPIKKRELEQKIQYLRDRKAQEEKVKRIRENLSRHNMRNVMRTNQSMPDIGGSSRINSNNTTSRNDLAMHPSTIDSRKAGAVNVNKLPNLTGYQAMAIIDHSSTIQVAQDADASKRTTKIQNQERPTSSGSGASKATGNYTSAYTQITGGQTNFTYNLAQKEEKEKMMNEMTSNRKFKLAEYLKFDTNLARDQNIEIGATSSLAAQDSLNVEGGVTLTCFAPQKRLKTQKKQAKEVFVDIHNEVIETDIDLPQKYLSYEEKIKVREQEERDGILAPREAQFFKDGGKLILKNQMTKSKYKKMFGHESRVQKIQQKLDEQRQSNESKLNNMQFSVEVLNQNEKTFQDQKVHGRNVSNTMKVSQSQSQFINSNLNQPSHNRLQTQIQEIKKFRYGAGPLSRSNSKGLQSSLGGEISNKPQSILALEMKFTHDFDQGSTQSKSPNKMNMTSIDSIYIPVGQKQVDKQLVTGGHNNMQVFNTKNPYQTNPANMLTSEVDVFRSTLSNSVQSHHRLEKLNKLTRSVDKDFKKSKNVFSSSQSSKRLNRDTASSLDMQNMQSQTKEYRQQSYLNNFRGATSSLKNVGKINQVSYYNPGALLRNGNNNDLGFDSQSFQSINKRLPIKTQNSVFENFNKSLMDKGSFNHPSKTLMDDILKNNPKGYSQLTMIAKKNVIQLNQKLKR